MILVERGDATPAQVADALAEQREHGGRIGELLLERGVEGERLARALAAQLRIEHAAPPLRPQQAAVRLVDRGTATRLRVVPLDVRGRVLRVATADPLDLDALAQLRFVAGRRVEAAAASAAAVDAGLLAAYGAGAVEELLDRLEPASGAANGAANGGAPADGADEIGALRRASEAAPIVALVDLLLERAVTGRASDLHIEPNADRLRVRARVDGVLRELVDLPARIGAGVVSRIKIMAGLDIATKRLPQDGRFAATAGGQDLSLRVSTLPAADGEKVVVRLLRQSGEGRSLDQLGLSRRDGRALRALLARGHGAILVTGPTGGGKTTTLYAALAALDRDQRNITTLEDPVEYRLRGVTQVPVQARGGTDFAGGLRAVLRQDPDIIMVGEMRDRATVEVGFAAALTGHLVLSTLHTNDAASAVTRLIEMGAAPYLIASALIGVVAQRLVRRLCSHCRAPALLPDAELDRRGLPRAGRFARPVGCERCDGTGYNGRIGVFEVLLVDERIRSLILERASVERVRAAARRGGMRLLGDAAAMRAGRGETSVAEVVPLLPPRGARRACAGCGAALRRAYLVCPMCGRAAQRRCGCGQRLRRDWSHCPRCGQSASRSSISCSTPS